MLHSPTEQTLAFRPDLQGLRAVAVMLVILAHADLGIITGGFIGVDVFFVISGYLITGILLRELEDNGRIAFMRFYARRLKRLLPALICMLCVTSIVAMWLLSATEARAQLASAPFAAAWLSNLYFAFRKLDYFDELAGKDLFLHTWSLGVEEQFYLIWPLVLTLLFLIGKSLRAAEFTSAKMLVPGISIVFILSLGLSLYWTLNLPHAAFYLMPARIWQLSLGALIYLMYLDKSRENRSARVTGLVNQFPLLSFGVGLILILGSATGLHSNLTYPGLWALLPAIGAALIILSGHGLREGKVSPLANPVLVWAGDRSYSLYLWHWPVFILGFSLGFQGQLIPTLSLMLLTLLAAIPGYRLVELPFWKGRFSHAQPLRIVLAGLLVMTVTIFFLYHGLRKLPQASVEADISFQWRWDLPVIYSMGCDAWYLNSRVEPCVFGSETAEKTVVFIGDSHGAQWFSMLPEIFPESSWRIIVLTKSACPLVDENYFYPRIGQMYQVCTDWRNAVLDEVDALRPEVIIMGSAVTYDFSDAQWVEGSARILERLAKIADKVFVMPGTPQLGFDGPGCVSRHLSAEGALNHSACRAEGRMLDVELVRQHLEQAAERFPNVHLLNLNDLVCPEATCNAVSKDGKVVFRDSQHLTDSFVRAQVPFIRERLQQFDNDGSLFGKQSD
jgi:peptidoglycan/LPS O-acetylase OafA/YrhL